MISLLVQRRTENTVPEVMIDKDTSAHKATNIIGIQPERYSASGDGSQVATTITMIRTSRDEHGILVPA